MVASTHWLASAAGMSVLERGGNAFDAAVATGLTLQVVEPHLNGPGGEVPALLFPVDRGEPIALCGQGVAPGAATIERYHELGHELVPGTGVLAACVPGAFGGWLLLLEQFGTWRLADVLEFAIGYAEHGFPLVAGIRATIDRTEELLRGWPGSRDLYLPAPEVGALFRNPALAATYRRIVDESRGGSREQEIEQARRAYYEGFVAEEIDRFSAAEGGLLTGEDMARWRASLEPVAKLEYRGLTVCKTLPWAAGPVGLQQLALLDGFDLAELSPGRVRPRRHRVRQARVRRPRRALRRRRGAARDAALEGVQRRAARARRRGGVRRLPPGDRPAAAARRGGGDARSGGADARRHRPPRRRRPPREHVLGDPERRLAAELARDPRARLAARHPRADVLARGGARLLAPPRRAPAHDALPGARAPRRQALSRLGHARRRPAGAVGAARLRPPRRARPEPAGGDRRARVPHGPPDLVLLSPRLRAPLGHRRGALRRRRRRRPARRAATTSRSPARGRSAA